MPNLGLQARHSKVPFGNLTAVLLRDGGAPRCTLVDVGRHFLSARIQLNADPRLRAAAVFPFGSDGRLTAHTAAELAAVLTDLLARSLTVESVRDRITLAVYGNLDIILVDFPCVYQLHHTPYTPWDMLHFVPMLIGC